MTGNLRPLAAAIVKSRSAKQERRIFVLDTNVLMHDPTAIFRFEEHDIYIPMTVLEELDAGKKGLSESARNVRQVSRFLDELPTRPPPYEKWSIEVEARLHEIS